MARVLIEGFGKWGVDVHQAWGMVGRVTASQIAAASAASVLPRLT
jgi:hypothetical protein